MINHLILGVNFSQNGALQAVLEKTHLIPNCPLDRNVPNAVHSLNSHHPEKYLPDALLGLGCRVRGVQLERVPSTPSDFSGSPLNNGHCMPCESKFGVMGLGLRFRGQPLPKRPEVAVGPLSRLHVCFGARF